jgi:P4 family phage/plasmid primase-like protien
MIGLGLPKKDAVIIRKETEILFTKNLSKYYITENHRSLLQIIKSQYEKKKQVNIYEFISKDSLVTLFFDIDHHTDPSNKDENVIQKIKDKLTCVLSDYQLQFIILEAHSDIKESYHLVVRIKDKNDIPCYIQSVQLLKTWVPSLFPELVKSKVIDTSVYREGLFRTIYSTKYNENRPFIKSNLSDPFDEVHSFVTFVDSGVYHIFNSLDSFNTTNNDIIKETVKKETEQQTLQQLQKELSEFDKDIIKKFVRKNYKYHTRDIREIFINKEVNCIVVALNDTYCYQVDREHKSNHQYIVIDVYSSKQKCHDLDCKDYKHNEIKINFFPKEVNEIILKCLKVNKQEQELIEKAIQECKDYITNNFDENIEVIEFDKNAMVFKGNVSNTNMVTLNGKCSSCKLEHYITNTGYCLKCSVCHSIYPKNQLIPVDDRYKTLNNFWMNYSQLINNGTVNININNYYNGEEEFSCDVQLDSNIIREKKLLKIVNECLDGHKITKLAELMSQLYKDYIFTGNDWYQFDGNKWSIDNKSLNFKRNILELCSLFNKIKQHYEKKSSNEVTSNLIKNIKSLVTKLNKPQLKDDILKESQLFYIDNRFFENLNSKKHLVPFDNGVYDLLENKFRKTKKEDYINFTTKFEYDDHANNREVYTFIENILPNKNVRDYVLKKMSECLNGDIPNTNFLMFIGDGANGKSQLLNLMKITMGDFGEKVEVTLLTRKRNNANEANTEKIKLMNKRFAFLSEPEDGEKINIGLLKELTGSEEIVARGLYQEAMSFVMEAKLFLACNELPEIKGEDTALWRRIRVIDFPSRFVDEPKEANEYKIDRTLPSRMREDITWRQTFVKILIEYYTKDVREPIEVQVTTNEYRKENNDFFNWLEENIVLKDDSVLNLKDVCLLYHNKEITRKAKNKVKKEMEKWLSKKHPHLESCCKESRFNNVRYNGWKGICVMEELE